MVNVAYTCTNTTQTISSMDARTVAAMALARDKIERLTGIKYFRHKPLLAAIHGQTGIEFTGGDLYQYLTDFTKQGSMATPKSPRPPQAYKYDIAMQRAISRIKDQPKPVSMSSKAKYWVDL